MTSIGSTLIVPYAEVPETTSATNGSDTFGGLARRAESVVSRETSVTTPRKRERSPCMLTNVPTFTSSVERSPSRRTSTPSVSEPPTTTPRRASRSPSMSGASFTAPASSVSR